MYILSLETSAKFASVAILKDGTILDTITADNQYKHAVTVLSAVSEILKKNCIGIHEIDCFAVDNGPGSFTGIRIGITIIDAFSYVNGKKVIPVSSLEALFNSVDSNESGTVCCIIDARNDNFYAAAYRNNKNILPLGAYTRDEILNICGEQVKYVGDIALNKKLSDQEKTYPDAANVALWAWNHQERATENVKAYYLRPSQAERMKKEKC